jgi:hypothetical protein
MPKRAPQHSTSRGTGAATLDQLVGAAFDCPIFGSVPAMSRWILPRCMTQTIAVSTANSGAAFPLNCPRSPRILD